MKRIFFLLCIMCFITGMIWAQNKDTIPKSDSLTKMYPVVLANDSILNSILNQNKLLNVKDIPVSTPILLHKLNSIDTLFYLLIVLLLLFAFFKFIYPKYFTNIFNVFFNTSLRQNQLTDQLLLATKPSFILNILFTISGGIYIYFILLFFKQIPSSSIWTYIIYIILLLSLIYLLKYFILKFIGWVTSSQQTSNAYIFIIFLINKVIGICILPFTILIALPNGSISYYSTIISLILLGLMFLLRFLKLYNILQTEIKINKFYFFICLIAIEILPILMLYKALLIFLHKKL